MKITNVGAKYSAIVGIGESLRKRSKETGEEFLYLNRGINAVTNINLTDIIPQIDFNSTDIQVYPPNNGRHQLRQAINEYYFKFNSSPDNIFITNGGMGGLDLIIKTLDVSKIFISQFYWGAYVNIMKINKINFDSYSSFQFLENNIQTIKNSAVIICDPNNPIGDKYDDEKLLNLLQLLNNNGITVIWDCPYRQLFVDENDNMYERLLEMENLIITESFSKFLGLSGQRIGFVHSVNDEFNSVFNTNLLYATNGINAFAQILVELLLTTEAGRNTVAEFKEITVRDITKNLQYLKSRNLLADDFYKYSEPIGIFTIVNKSFDELLQYRIGSVPLSFFTSENKESAEKYARICVSIPHDNFRSYFDKIEPQKKIVLTH